MEHGDQIEAVAPVFLEIGIQDCGMNQVAVHDSPRYRRRAAYPEALPLRKVPVLPASAKHGSFRVPVIDPAAVIQFFISDPHMTKVTCFQTL